METVLQERAAEKFLNEEGKVPEKQFVNYYRCPEDGQEWADVWRYCCNDRCPKCGLKDIEPYKSAEVVHTNPKHQSNGSSATAIS